MDEQQGSAGRGRKAGGLVEDQADPATKRYDLYYFSPSNGLILGWRIIEEPDEEAAARRVQSLEQQAPMELWCDGVLIRRWNRTSGHGRKSDGNRAD